MGLSIASHGNTQPLIPEEKKERREMRKNEKMIKGNTEDLMLFTRPRSRIQGEV